MFKNCSFFLLFVIVFLTAPGTLCAQTESDLTAEETKLFESGKGLFEEKLYFLAYERFKNILAKHPDDLYVKYLTGICGIFISDKHEEAMALLTEVKEKNKKAADIDFYFALLYHKIEEFDKSIELSTTLLDNSKIKTELKTILKANIEHCKNAKELVKSPITALIANLGSPPNTEAAEYAPVITADEETILFTYRGKESTGGTRDIHDKPHKYGYYYEDVFMSKKVDGKWQKAEGVASINTESHDGAIALSIDGQQLFIFRANAADGGDIYVSELEGTQFSVPQKLKGEINTKHWEGSISLSGTQKKVVFASDRPGGNGGRDLYEATKQADGSWGNVKNLGNNVNTPEDEDAPFLHPDGRTLVFSSKGHNSMGDFDIFTSDLDEKDSTWKKPVNLGYPVNTTDDDIYYVLSADGRRGYFSSAKTGGAGDKDIYVVEPAIRSKKAYLTIIKGKITENLNAYSGEVIVVIANGDHNYGTFKSNSASGNYLLSLPSGYNYKLSFHHPKFGARTFDVFTEKVDGYAEKILDVNFDSKDTAARHETIVLETKDTTKTIAVAAVTTETKTAEVKTETKTETTATGNDPVASKADILKMSRSELLNKFGATKINGLKYLVQVGAYRHPENYKPKKISKICTPKRAGVINGDVNLIVTDKEFDTWKEADEFSAQVKSLGQTDAFLTANYNGKRFYLKELVEQGIWLSPAN